MAMQEQAVGAKAGSRLVAGENATLSEIRDHQRRIMTWLAVLTAVVAGFGLVGGGMLIARVASSFGLSSSDETKGSVVVSAATNQGPWGDLVAVPIKICPPLELLRASTPVDDHQVVWRWPSLDSPSLRALLAGLRLSDGLLTELMAMAQPDAQIHGLSMRPSREFILKLKQSDRSELYTALSKYFQNGDQGLAFRYHGRSIKDWLQGMPISPSVKEQIRSLAYQRGSYWFFADLRSIESSFASPEERTNVLKAMSSEPTYMLRLKVTPQSDVESLVRYWGRGGREKDVRPLIEAMANIEGGNIISAAYLLPPFARNRLCTYPVPAESGIAMRQDCHWSALNFFSAQPDDRYCDSAEVLRTLTQDYYRVYSNPQLGDVVEFLDENGSGRHAAVFIADDFVFTKNGVSSSRPWMLMKLGELKDYYPNRTPFDIRFYRRKDL
jgi:uncharacterized membrane-anchored protein YhcB (DUF1043 family)